MGGVPPRTGGESKPAGCWASTSAHLIARRPSTASPDVVEGRILDVSPLPREPEFHHRGIARGQHCRHRVVGDARGVRRPLALNADGCSKCGENGIVGSPALGGLAVSG
jgi:hypothetical protein